MAQMYMLVIDLEATCKEHDRAFDKETIEIGAVWASREGEVIESLQVLIKPSVNTQLTAFCTQLTGITQTEVDAGVSWPHACEQLSAFAQQQRARYWGSWGNYDKNQIAKDCKRHDVANPLGHLEHVNLKEMFAKRQGTRPPGMAAALAYAGLPLQGAHHRGLDDARNIASLLPHCYRIA